MTFPEGILCYYPKKGQFTAWCTNKEHGSCSLSRANKAKSHDKDTNAPYGGRPLGFLLAWLVLSHETPKDDHGGDGKPALLRTLDYESRAYYRTMLFALGTPDALLLFRREREWEPELELEEPETLVGLV